MAKMSQAARVRAAKKAARTRAQNKVGLNVAKKRREKR